MEHKHGIHALSLFGEENVNTLRRYYKQTGAKQVLTDRSMHSLIFNGDSIPGFEYGTLLRINLGRRSDVLAISTRYGPVILQVTGKTSIQILMNKQLKKYATKKLQGLDFAKMGRYNAMTQFLGHHDKETGVTFYNIGEMVEQDQSH